MSERAPVTLTLGASERTSALQEVAGEVQRRLDRLQVPAMLSIEVPPGAADPSRAVLAIDGATVEFATRGDLAYALDRACHRARELVITGPVAAVAWRNWFNEECPAPLADPFRRLLRDAVRWGFRLDRLRPAAEQLRGGATDVTLLFEEAVEEVDTEIVVHIPPDEEPDTSKLQDRMFEQLGLYLHPPKVVTDPTVEPAEIRIACNDLLLPRERQTGDAIADAIRAHASAFMTARLTGFYLAQLWRSYPRVVETLAKRFDERILTRVLRLLLDEGVSIRDLRSIAESLLNVSAARLQVEDYAEYARMGLWRRISHAHRNRERTLEAYLLDPDFERRIAAAGGIVSSDDARAFVGAARAQIAEQAQPGVLLTILEARRHVRRLLERDLPEVAVLSYQELAADTVIQPLARIGP